MATIDKLEYINSTKTLIKNALNTNFNSQIGDNDTFRNYVPKINDIYTNWPKITEEGTNFTLNSTKEGKINSILLKGNSSQNTNIITYICLGTETGDYYFTYNSINYQFTMPTIFTNDLLVFNTDTLKLYLDTTEISTITENTGTLITMDTTPNPKYSQSIHVVTGNNSVEICGKNLFNKNNAIIKTLNAQQKTGNTGTYGAASYQKHVYIKCSPNTKYAIQKDNNINTVLGVYESSEVPAVGVKYKTLYLTTKSSTGKTTVTTGENAKYLDIRITGGETSDSDLQIILNSLQIESNSTVTTYISYQGQNYPINLGNLELCKITTECQDKIFHNIPSNPYYRNDLIENNWYVSKEIGKFIPTGNETWTYDSTYNYCRMGGGVFEDSVVQNNNQMNTHFQYLTNSWNAFRNAKTTNGTYMLSSVASSNYQLCIRNVNLTKQSEYIAWIKENNPIFYYQLETPKIILITDNTLIEQLERLEKATSYDEQTNIIQTNNDLSFFINVSALKKNSSN